MIFVLVLVLMRLAGDEDRAARHLEKAALSAFGRERDDRAIGAQGRISTAMPASGAHATSAACLLAVDFLPAQNLAYSMNTQRGLFLNSRWRLFAYALCVPDVIRDLIQLRCRSDYARVREFGYVAGLPDKALPRCFEEQHRSFLAGHREAPPHRVTSIPRRRIAVCTMPHTVRSSTCHAAGPRCSGYLMPMLISVTSI